MKKHRRKEDFGTHGSPIPRLVVSPVAHTVENRAPSLIEGFGHLVIPMRGQGECLGIADKGGRRVTLDAPSERDLWSTRLSFVEAVVVF